MKTIRAFILIDMIISALILTSAVAATMYLFRIGFKELMKANTVNEISSKIPQAYGFLKTIDFKQTPKGEQTLGENSKLTWNAKLIATAQIQNKTLFISNQNLPYKLYLYEVNFSISYKNYQKHFSTDIMQYKFIGTPFNQNIFIGF